jgi:hypothetical protein
MLTIRLTTLDPSRYEQALTWAERLQKIKQQSWSDKRSSWRNSPGRDKLVAKESEILQHLIFIAKHQGEWTDLIKDSEQEVTAFDDLLSTIQRVHPQTAPTLLEVGAILLPAERVPDVLAKYRGILESIDLDYMIHEQTEFGRVLGPAVYFEANKKYMKILQRAATRHLSVLNLLEGEV